MTRLFAAFLIGCIPITARADDPKPDVAKLKDEVELLEAKLEVEKAKVVGAEELIAISKDFLGRLKEAEQKGAAAAADMLGLMQSHAKATADRNIAKAEMRVAEVKLNQAKRRLAAAEKPDRAKPAKTYTFSFVNKPWGEVFDWFSAEAGLINKVAVKPAGTLTLKPAAGKKYTLSETVDLLNEFLAPGFHLVRREASFTVIAADEKPDADLFPRIDLADLGNYGKTEIVHVLVPFSAGLNPEETIPQLKVMLSAFGSIHAVGKKTMLICDKAGNIRRIKAEIETLHGPK